MRKNRLLAFAAGMTVAAAALADIPFREHRYDSFKAAPLNEKSIVFYGNSITNMNEWWECFGSAQHIANRGNSGAYSWEMVDNIESIIAGQPAKLFVAIGTNDLGTAGHIDPDKIAGNIRALIERMKAESPGTEVYIQSILPTNNGLRTPENVQLTNSKLRELCEETGTTFIDLYDALLAIITEGNPRTISYDSLHLTAKGYKIWCDIIAPYVGADCTYPESFEQKSAGMPYAYGMRATTWSAEEVTENDVLFIGDEMVHGGEWHELLNNPNVKNRGIVWGYGGRNTGDWLNSIEPIFATNPERKAAPRQALIYIGTNEVNGSGSAADFKAAYQGIIDRIRTYAPAEKTELLLVSQLPQHDAAHNANRVEPFNAVLAELASENPNTSYLDIYTPLLDGNVADTECIDPDRYLNARGYNRVAGIIASRVEGCTPLSVAQFERHYAYVNARERLGSVIETLRNYPEGDGPGQYSAESLASAKEAVESSRTLLCAQPADTAAILGAAATLGDAGQNIAEKINRPRAWTEENPVCVRLRSARGNLYVTSKRVTVTGQDDPEAEGATWRLIDRGDGSFDIVSTATGRYINPAASYNQQLRTATSRPEAGWTFSYCDVIGAYIISSGSAQFNQTNSANGFKVFNWGGGTNRTDDGCTYFIEETDEPQSAITEIAGTDAPARNAVYDLQGRSVSAPDKGIYIINGTKQLVK